MASFDDTLGGWKKKNQVIGVKMADKSAGASKFNEDNKWKEFAKSKGFTHYVALKLNTLMPLKDLTQRLGLLQDELVIDLGQGVVSKTGEPGDLFVRLIGLQQTMPHAIEMALRSVKPLDIIERPMIEIGGLLPAADRVDVSLFSKVLNDLVDHLHQQLGRASGVKAERLSVDGSLVQAGLFRLPILNINKPDEFKKPPKKGRVGKFDFYKLLVVDLADNSLHATIDIGEPDFTS